MTVNAVTYPDIEEALLYWLVSEDENNDSLILRMVFDAGVEYTPEDPEEIYPYEFGEPVTHVGTVTPSDLQAKLPFVRVSLVAGQDDRVTDYSVVDIEVFAARRSHARWVAEIIREVLTRRHVRIDTPDGVVVLDGATTQVKPYALPWDDPGIDRYLGTYEISARR